jgi:hypothetical protein
MLQGLKKHVFKSEGKDDSVVTPTCFGEPKAKSGGSYFLGKGRALIALMGGGVMILDAVVFRIRVDGTFVAEPSVRGDLWNTKQEREQISAGETVSAREGRFVWDLVGDAKNEVALATAAVCPDLKKRLKYARSLRGEEFEFAPAPAKDAVNA